MRILVVGANGHIGQVACAELEQRHEIVRAGRSTGDIKVDLSQRASVEAMYRDIGPLDAVISTAGDVHFAPLSEHTSESFLMGLHQKLMGQINLVLAGVNVVTDAGSFTLTSGVLDREPVITGTAAATANGGLAGFVKSAAIELPRGLRINVVSPGLLKVSSERYDDIFPGHERVSSAKVGRAFSKCVEGALTGEVVIVA